MPRRAGFTVRTSQRELKLRAPTASDYEAWMSALKPFIGEFKEGVDESPRGAVGPSVAGRFDDDGDSDD